MKRLIPILLVSVAVRLTVPTAPMQPTITATYRTLGANIRAGYGYTLDDGSAPITYYTPGYAYWQAVGGYPFQPLIDGTFGPLLLWLALRRAGFCRAAWAAAVGYALALPVAVATRWLIPDALTSIFCLGGLLPVLIWRDRRGAIASGLAIGTAGWFRGDVLALVPLLAIVVFAMFGWRMALLYAAAWLVPAIALGLFYLFHYGAFSLTRSGSGLLLWEGLEQSDGGDERAGALLVSNGLAYGTAEGDAFLMREYARHAAETPGLIIRQGVERFARVVTLQGADWGNSVTNWRALVIGLMALAAAGFYRARRSPVTWLFVALWLSRVVPFSLMRDEPRFVLPVLVVYIVGASLLLEKRIRRTRWINSS